MSIIDDQIRRLDALLDKIQLSESKSQDTLTLETVSKDAGKGDRSRERDLATVIRALSTTASSRPLLRPERLRSLIVKLAAETETDFQEQSNASVNYSDLEWVATGKATVQLYGLILNTLLQETIPLSEYIWYWDDILGSYANTALYTLQTAPERFWKQSKEVYADAREKFRTNTDLRQSARDASSSLSGSWREFYSLVQNSIEERSLSQAQNKILSPFAICRIEARRKQNNIRKLREIGASAIGLVVNEGLIFQNLDEDDKINKTSSSPSPEKSQWRSTVAKSVSLLENILCNAGSLDNSLSEFEDAVFSGVDTDPEFVSTSDATQTTTTPAKLAKRLMKILDEDLPGQQHNSQLMSLANGKPSRIVRYWIPGVILLLSGTTLLRVIANRRAEITQWIREFGATVMDFWTNWVVEPSKKLIGTIRHDEQSEIAIMSKDSLKADRDSLERMVVDFAIEHPDNGTKYSENQITEIRAKVKQGDLTPVLKAYEREMQSPIRNAIIGDLIRTLLIQIQKTKVDVEVAIGGIDSLLKSQELLFGFVGIAPGVFISYAVFQWLRGIFGGGKGVQKAKSRGESVRLLRNIHRTLSTSTPMDNGLLSYKDHGLLLCELHILRQRAAKFLPGNVQREFLEDINDLMDVRIGIDRQIKVLERVNWAYAKWLQ